MTAPARSDPAPPPAVSPRAALAAKLNQYKPVMGKLLRRSGVDEETFVAQVANAMRSKPELWNCDIETVLGAALRCAQLGLPPNDGGSLVNIIPYGRTATFQLGYGGVLELARRAIPGALFDGEAVYDGDLFDIDLGRDPPLRFVPAYARRPRRERGKEAYAWWVRVRFPDGRTHVHSIDRDRAEYHRSFSRQPDGPAWTKSYDAMALKSVVWEMRRWLPHTPDLALAAAAEGEVTDVRELDEADSNELTVDPNQLTLDEAAT